MSTSDTTQHTAWAARAALAGCAEVPQELAEWAQREVRDLAAAERGGEDGKSGTAGSPARHRPVRVHCAPTSGTTDDRPCGGRGARRVVRVRRGASTRRRCGRP
eukprot:5449487-Prymnesium_polylepis.1